MSQGCRWVLGSPSSRTWQPSHRVSMVAAGGPLAGRRAWQPITEPLVLSSIQPRSLRIRTCCKLQASSAPTLQDAPKLCCAVDLFSLWQSAVQLADEFGERLILIGSSIACFPHHPRSLGAKAWYRTQLLLDSCWPIYYLLCFLGLLSCLWFHFP